MAYADHLTDALERRGIPTGIGPAFRWAHAGETKVDKYQRLRWIREAQLEAHRLATAQ